MAPLAVRFWDRVQGGDGCWLWTGATHTTTGYGIVRVNGKNEGAHRVAYRLLVGEISPTKQIDHVCHNLDANCPGGRCVHRRCVRPDHLRAVTRRENLMAGKGPAAVNRRKEFCSRGHPLSGTGSSVYRYGQRRLCRRCRAINAGEFRARRQ